MRCGTPWKRSPPPKNRARNGRFRRGEKRKGPQIGAKNCDFGSFGRKWGFFEGEGNAASVTLTLTFTFDPKPNLSLVEPLLYFLVLLLLASGISGHARTGSGSSRPASAPVAALRAPRPLPPIIAARASSAMLGSPSLRVFPSPLGTSRPSPIRSFRVNSTQLSQPIGSFQHDSALPARRSSGISATTRLLPPIPYTTTLHAAPC